MDRVRRSKDAFLCLLYNIRDKHDMMTCRLKQLIINFRMYKTKQKTLQ